MRGGTRLAFSLIGFASFATPLAGLCQATRAASAADAVRARNAGRASITPAVMQGNAGVVVSVRF